MNATRWRASHIVVALGYLAGVLVSVVLVYGRYRQYQNNPSAGQLWPRDAIDNWLLELLIGGLFLVPTLMLALIIRRSEPASIRYARTLLGLSLSAPLCLAIFMIPVVHQLNSIFAWVVLGRLSLTPVSLVAFGASRLLAAYSRAKRLLSYALLIEVGTVAIMIVILYWTK